MTKKQRILLLIDKLEKTKVLSKQFKKTIDKLFNLLPKNAIKPINYFLGKKCVVNKYSVLTNFKDKIKINKLNLPNKKNCRELVLPVHVNNRVTGNKHLMIFVMKLAKNRITKIYRIDPSNSKRTSITEAKLNRAFKHFKKRNVNYNYAGFHKKSRIFIHKHTCRFATPLLYKYSTKLNNKLYKKKIIEYFRSFV